MMAQSQARVYFEGLPRLMRLLREDVLLAGIWRDAMTEATELGVESVRRVASEGRATGLMQASVTGRLAATPVPRSGVISNNAARGKIRYPFILQSGKGKAGSTPHFRGSATPTRGWMNRAIEDVQHQINRILEKAVGRIEDRWERG